MPIRESTDTGSVSLFGKTYCESGDSAFGCPVDESRPASSVVPLSAPLVPLIRHIRCIREETSRIDSREDPIRVEQHLGEDPCECTEGEQLEHDACHGAASATASQGRAGIVRRVARQDVVAREEPAAFAAGRAG